jgi:hypothetical protein
VNPVTKPNRNQENRPLDTILIGRPSVVGIELKVHRPHPIRRIGNHDLRHGAGADAFAAAPLRYPQATSPASRVMLPFTREGRATLKSADDLSSDRPRLGLYQRQ